MSGGGLDYLQYKSARELMKDLPELKSMAELVFDEGYPNLARTMMNTYNALREVEGLLDAVDESLGDTSIAGSVRAAWKTLDYGFAGDWSMEPAREAEDNL
jgi:hypothetical protein